MINKDEAAGKLEQGKGVVKEKVGEWTDAYSNLLSVFNWQ